MSRLAGGVVMGVVVLLAGGYVWFVGFRDNSLHGADWLERAFAQARAWHADAELIGLQGTYVDAKGHGHVADLDGTWRFTFRSASAANAAADPAPSVPGAPPARTRQPDCFFRFSAYKHKGSVHSTTSGNTSCLEESLPGRPRCSIVQIWQRAIAAGAPNPAYADIRLRTKAGTRTWSFDIMDRAQNPPTPMFTRVFPDDCAP